MAQVTRTLRTAYFGALRAITSVVVQLDVALVGEVHQTVCVADCRVNGLAIEARQLDASS